MKQLTFIIALFAALSTQAQNVTRDTLYTVNIGGRFLEVQRFDYTDGSYSETSKAIGDTTALIDYMELRFYKTAQTCDRLASQLRFAPRDLGRMVQEDAAAQASFGRSPLIELQQQYDSTFLIDTYTLNDAAVTFGRTAAGKLRMTQGTTNYIVDLFGEAMRVRNYPATGKVTILYLMNANLWQDAGADVFLRRTAIAARKPAGE
jgi:hypothetical protein